MTTPKISPEEVPARIAAIPLLASLYPSVEMVSSPAALAGKVKETARPYSMRVGKHYYAPWWVVGPTQRGTIAAPTLRIAKELFEAITGETPTSVGRLPYGASPALNVVRYDAEGKSLSCHGYFCFSPDTCKGRTSCPRNYACSE